MTLAVLFVFFETGVVANFAIAIPVVVMVEASAWTIPITAVEAAAIMARSNPMRPDVGRTAPVAFVPAVVTGNRIPIAADPDEVGSGLRGHYDDCTRRGRRADLNADGYLSFRRNACQQKCGKRGSLEQSVHSISLLKLGSCFLPCSKLNAPSPILLRLRE